MSGEDYAEAVRIVLGEVPDLPYVPELPERGATASMTGRTLAMIGELGFDLQPAGWRLTDRPGVDHRRARSLLAHDLDVVEEQAQGLDGELKVQLAGPWTLAATVERPRGDRLLADHGARRELAQALAHGLTEHLRDVHRRLPGASLLVQVDEPALPAVLAGQVPTASAFGRHRVVHPPEASEALEWVFAAIAGAEAVPLAHCCASDVPVALLRDAGARGISVDLGVLGAAAYDEIGTLLDAGERLLLGVVPALEPAERPGERQLVDRIARLCDMLGFAPEEIAGQLVLTPSCGLAGASTTYTRTILRLLRETARHVAEG